MKLRCAVCMFVPDTPHVAAPAVTVVEGYAVCEDHLGLVAMGPNFASITQAARRVASR